MSKDLTTSVVARDNILNNTYALTELEKNLELGGVKFEGETVFTKEQVATLLDVTERTIDNYIANYSEELAKNGYKILKGNALKNIKLAYVNETDFVHINAKTSALSIFTFRALLNLAMLITESERAKAIRSRMLDMVIDVIAQKTGGKTKYINQRDANYLIASYTEDSYRKIFTDALRDYLDMGQHKYVVYTNKIYKAVFCERAQEYKKILDLSKKDKIRDTLYTEVLNAIGSFENGLAVQLKQQYEKLGRKLTSKELDELIQHAEESPFLQPFILDARTKMASRDLAFREALHYKLEHYIQAVPQGDFDKFLGEKSRSLQEQLSDTETLAVLKRLKDR